MEACVFKWLTLLASLLASIGSLGLLILACITYRSWKSEHLFKVKLDLLGEILIKTRDYKGLIKHIAFPAVYSSDTDAIKNKLKEEGDTNIKDNKVKYLVYKYRENNNIDKIRQYSSLKHRACVYWDIELSNKIEEIWKLVFKFGIYGEALYSWEKDDLTDKVYNKYYDFLFGDGEKEALVKIEEFIKEIECNLNSRIKKEKWINIDE